MLAITPFLSKLSLFSSEKEKKLVRVVVVVAVKMTVMMMIMMMMMMIERFTANGKRQVQVDYLKMSR